MELKQYAKENNIPIIMDEGLEFIVNFIEANNIESILEIGTAIGYSALMWANCPTIKRVVTIERNKELHQQAIVNCQNQNKIELIYADALKYQTTEKFDLLFIDGAKSKYSDFFKNFYGNCQYAICDNIDFHGIVDDPSLTKSRRTKALVKKIRIFREELESRDEIIVNYHNSGDGLLVIKRK